MTKMKEASHHEIEFIKSIITSSIAQLITSDSEIFNLDLDIELEREISEPARRMNRKLHETCINHRLAHYLENEIDKTDLNYYHVDIEYNRFYGNLKMLHTINGLLSVRPDIIIHSRIDHEVNPQHLLIIEAKKELISKHDVNKIKGFIEDPQYNYVFGLSISYCSNPDQILADLYYFNGLEIIKENINVPKS